jgi:hypothetical protein
MSSSTSYDGNGRSEVTFQLGGTVHGLPRLNRGQHDVAQLDRLKEQVAYLKFWQGVVVVTDISLAGWLISAADAAHQVTVFLAMLGLILLSFGIVVLHRQIERRIEQIGVL